METSQCRNCRKEIRRYLHRARWRHVEIAGGNGSPGCRVATLDLRAANDSGDLSIPWDWVATPESRIETKVLDPMTTDEDKVREWALALMHEAGDLFLLGDSK